MSEEEQKDILKYIYSDKFFCNKLPFYRGDSIINIDDKKLPVAIWRIKQRLLDREDLREYRTDPNFDDIITVIFPGGRIHEHADPNGGDLTFHVRFNIFLQIPDRYNTFYGGEVVEAKERHYVMCRSGIDKHWSSLNNTSIPRIALSFGFMLPISKILKLYKVPNRVENDFYLKLIGITLYNTYTSIISMTVPMSYMRVIYPDTKNKMHEEVLFISLLESILEDRKKRPTYK